MNRTLALLFALFVLVVAFAATGVDAQWGGGWGRGGGRWGGGGWNRGGWGGGRRWGGGGWGGRGGWNGGWRG
ncbi:hypothetical protein TYRP_010423 [Tyrophagus putrescentiae]|nr:hypothetical protein TYRP_010423 [Tyrophagus putrescentiae]